MVLLLFIRRGEESDILSTFAARTDCHNSTRWKEAGKTADRDHVTLRETSETLKTLNDFSCPIFCSFVVLFFVFFPKGCSSVCHVEKEMSYERSLSNIICCLLLFLLLTQKEMMENDDSIARGMMMESGTKSRVIESCQNT